MLLWFEKNVDKSFNNLTIPQAIRDTPSKVYKSNQRLEKINKFIVNNRSCFSY